MSAPENKKPQNNRSVFSLLSNKELAEIMDSLRYAEMAYESYIDRLMKIHKIFWKKKREYESSKDEAAADTLSEFLRELEALILSVPDPYDLILRAEEKGSPDAAEDG